MLVSDCAGFGQRHVFLLMSFLGLVVAYMLRVILFVAVVTMVNSTAIEPPTNGIATTTKGTLSDDECPVDSGANKTKVRTSFA